MEYYQKQPHQGKYKNPTDCPVINTLSLISGKWKMVIFWAIVNDINRFGAIMKAVPDISKRMLTKELRELEMDELVSRQVYAEVPPRVEYSLTDRGKSLMPILEEMKRWGEMNFDQSSTQAYK
ncbi:MAG: helix-turn-helix transcriptional regulator [Flavobacteriales bacterium]|nr:helix-turn-helix transcriptional regulator [Flavobacteriales bacterium]